MPPVSVQPEKVDTAPHSTRFQRVVREQALYRPHHNGFTGSEVYRRKKLAGERPIRYDDLLAAIKMARRVSGPDAVCALVNSIVHDSLENADPADVVATRVDADELRPIESPRDEQLRFCVAAAQLIEKADCAISTGVYEACALQGAVGDVVRYGRRLLRSIDNDTDTNPRRRA